jgi:CHAD domain-containing protein
MHALIELRVKHEKKLRKMLTKEVIRDIQKRLRRGAKGVHLDTTQVALAVARTMLTAVVRPSGPMSEDVLHQYRIVIKRARYAAEFAPRTAESAQFIERVKRLQDAVGNWHDWLTLTETAAKRLGEINNSSLVAALHNVTGGKFRHAVAALSASPTIQTTASPTRGTHPSVRQAAEQARKPGSSLLAVAGRTETAA